MSASKKKQLRSEEKGKLTERQIAEQKEAQKVKLYSIAFVVVLAALIIIAITVGINRAIVSSGVHEKNTIAATVGEHEISNAELNYYYIDYINNYASTYGSYLSLFGIDTSVALDKQVYDEESGETWADVFISEAAASAQSVYALADAAEAEGFTLPQEQQDELDLLEMNLDGYASIYGYSDTSSFLKAQYGNGASKASYLDYYSRNLLASAYQTAHQDSLTYTEDEIREADAADPAKYSTFSYAQYAVAVSKYLTGGTTDENGTTTYTAAERAAAVEAANEAVATLTEATTLDELNEAIAAMSINEGTEASATVYTSQASSSINSNFASWITDAAREEGDIDTFAVTTTYTDENGEEYESTSTIYVVRYDGLNTNEVNMINVRHILVSFDGETDEDGNYTDETRQAALTSAEEILAEWESGDKTEESFAALAETHSTDTGSNANGGLYENVYPGQMVTAFNDWCFDESRQVGDTGIVETSYGYHVMYFSGTCDQTYRDYQIVNTLTSEEMETWYHGLVDACVLTMGDTSYMRSGIVLS